MSYARPLLFLLWALWPTCAAADEAIDKLGRHYAGTLLPGNFQLAKTDRSLSLKQVQLVRFPDHPAALPSCKLTHQILFPGEQRLTGALLNVGVKDIRFQIVTGETLTLPRDKVQGIVPADGRIIRWTEDFDGKELSLGTTTLERRTRFFRHEKSRGGRQKAGEVTVRIPADQKADLPRRLSLHFFDAGLPKDTVSRRFNSASKLLVIVRSPSRCT